MPHILWSTHTNYFRHICMNSLRFAYDSDWALSTSPSFLHIFFLLLLIQIGLRNPISHLSYVDYNCSTAITVVAAAVHAVWNERIENVHTKSM